MRSSQFHSSHMLCGRRNTDWHLAVTSPPREPVASTGALIATAAMGFKRILPHCTGCQNSFLAYPQVRSPEALPLSDQSNSVT